MGTRTVAHSGGRHVGRCAAVRGGVRHAAIPCEGRINGSPTLLQAVAAPPGSGVRVLRTLMGAASFGVRSARPLPQPQQRRKLVG